MADERDSRFAFELTRMNEDEVRLHFDPSVQPVPFSRAMAVTELERRRQQRADAIMRPNFSLGRATVWIAMIAAIGALVWLWWKDYVG